MIPESPEVLRYRLQCDDPLAPARGIAVASVIGAAFWAVLILAVFA